VVKCKKTTYTENTTDAYLEWAKEDAEFKEIFNYKKEIKPYGEIIKITNKTNGKIYIEGVKLPLYGKQPKGKLIKEAIEKYGRDNFFISQLGTCHSESELFVGVRAAIHHFNSRNPEVGYNLGPGTYIKDLDVDEIEHRQGPYPAVVLHDNKFWLIMHNADFVDFCKQYSIPQAKLRESTVEVIGDKEGKISERYPNLKVFRGNKHKTVVDVTEEEDLINKNIGDSNEKQ